VSPGNEYKLRLPNGTERAILARSVPGAMVKAGQQGAYVQFDGLGESPI
jgi:hypothetical protein